MALPLLLTTENWQLPNLQNCMAHLRSADQLPCVLDSINFLDPLVAANRLDPWESQSEPAGMAIAWLDRVKSDLENDLRSHHSKMAFFSARLRGLVPDAHWMPYATSARGR